MDAMFIDVPSIVNLFSDSLYGLVNSFCVHLYGPGVDAFICEAPEGNPTYPVTIREIG